MTLGNDATFQLVAMSTSGLTVSRLVYAVAIDPHCADGITQQTQNTMEDLDRILKSAGSGKAGLIQATVYLRDVKQKPAMDAVWNK